jgi:type 1 glutamine amidotransferase
MRLFMGLLVLLVMIAVLQLSAPPSVAEADKIDVLIVDGFSNHDWKKTTELIRGILEPTGAFRVAVSTSPPKADAAGWDRWRPRFRDYDVVIQNSNDIGGGPSWPKDVQKDFEEYVRDGGGVFIFHSANNAFPSWPAYNDIIGLGWRGKDQGVALSIRQDEQTIERIPAGEGRNTGHGPRIDAVLTRLGEHPIHKGLPKRWKTPGLEVYFYARGPAKNLEVLSYAFDPQTKQNWPIEWVVTYGKGRVYNSTFGHVWKGDVQPASMRCAGVQTILVRGLQWLAHQPVTFPVPDDFPTADKLSVRAEISTNLP